MHAYQIPPVISSSIKLCPNEIYPPLHLVGNNLALYGDDAHSAVINSAGRQFGLIVEGSSNFVQGVTVQARIVNLETAVTSGGEPWLGGAVSSGTWTGTPLRAVLERAGVRSEAVEILVTGADHGNGLGILKQLLEFHILG